MNTSDLITIAVRVFDEEGQLLIDELLEEGKLDEAKEYLLFGIDGGWTGGALTFEDAEELHQMLGISPEHAARFRQENLGVLYK